MIQKQLAAGWDELVQYGCLHSKFDLAINGFWAVKLPIDLWLRAARAMIKIVKNLGNKQIITSKILWRCECNFKIIIFNHIYRQISGTFPFNFYLPASTAELVVIQYLCQWIVSLLVQVMAWQQYVPSLYLNQRDLLSNGAPGTVLSEISSEILKIPLTKMHLKSAICKM